MLEPVLIFLAGVLTGVVIPVATWLLKPDWLRQRLGLERPPEPEPYQLAHRDLDQLRRDPVIGDLLTAALARGEAFTLMLPGLVPKYLQDGYHYFKTPAGQPCVYTRVDYRGTEQLYLLVKPGAKSG